MTTAERAAMTRQQYEAACKRIKDAGPLTSYHLYISERYCAIGALLNGPEGFSTEDLIDIDSQTAAAQDDSGNTFAQALPDKARARLREVYGLADADDIDRIINVNDMSGEDARAFSVLVTLGEILGLDTITASLEAGEHLKP